MVYLLVSNAPKRTELPLFTDQEKVNKPPSSAGALPKIYTRETSAVNVSLMILLLTRTLYQLELVVIPKTTSLSGDVPVTSNLAVMVSPEVKCKGGSGVINLCENSSNAGIVSSIIGVTEILIKIPPPSRTIIPIIKNNLSNYLFTLNFPNSLQFTIINFTKLRLSEPSNFKKENAKSFILEVFCPNCAHPHPYAKYNSDYLYCSYYYTKSKTSARANGTSLRSNFYCHV